jgi:hypothetical protein
VSRAHRSADASSKSQYSSYPKHWLDSRLADRSAFSYEIPLSHTSSGSFRVKEELLGVLASGLIDIVHLTDDFESLPGSISAKITRRCSADQRIRSWTSETR